MERWSSSGGTNTKCLCCAVKKNQAKGVTQNLKRKNQQQQQREVASFVTTKKQSHLSEVIIKSRKKVVQLHNLSTRSLVIKPAL